MVIKEFEEGLLTLGMWDGGVMTVDMDYRIVDRFSYDDNRVYALHQTKNKTLWIGTWGGGGLFLEDGEQVYHYSGTGLEGGDIGHSVVYSFVEDRVGNVWIGTNGGGGIFRSNPSKTNYLKLKHNPEDPMSLDAGKINTIFKDKDGSLWVAVYNKGLNILDNETQVIHKYNTQNDFIHDQIMDIIAYGDDVLLASGGAGVIKYDRQSEEFERLNIVDEDVIVYALETDFKNHLWVGTYLEGVYEFDEELKLINHFYIDGSIKISDDLVYDLLYDSNGYMWIGTNNGLNVYNTMTEQMIGTYTKMENQQSLPVNAIRNLLQASDGSIWIGTTGGGVTKYMPDIREFHSYTEKEGLADNTVVGLLESKDGRIWAATHNGISIIDDVSNQVVNLTPSDGIGGYNFTGSGYKDVQHTMYFGGSFGVSEIPATIYSKETLLPPLYITKMYVLNTIVDESIGIYNGKEYVLSAKENYVAFEFSALDYENTNQLQYSYYLEGVDEAYIEIGNRNYVSYSNLKPGSYKFHVRVKTSQGDYTDSVSVGLTIRKPWYLSIFAYISYIFISLFLIYSLRKIRETRIIGKKNEELTEMSTKDPLTEIYNRRYFDSVLYDYIQLARRSRNYISLIMLDMDNFKVINDRYGHVVGDGVLRSLTRIIVDELPRKTDFCARYGGDEFAIVLYDTDRKGALEVAKRIMNSTSIIPLKNQKELTDVRTTISMGINSIIPDEGLNMTDLVNQADMALYEAKTSGKNRVICYEDQSTGI